MPRLRSRFGTRGNALWIVAIAVPLGLFANHRRHGDCQFQREHAELAQVVSRRNMVRASHLNYLLSHRDHGPECGVCLNWTRSRIEQEIAETKEEYETYKGEYEWHAWLAGRAMDQISQK